MGLFVLALVGLISVSAETYHNDVSVEEMFSKPVAEYKLND